MTILRTDKIAGLESVNAITGSVNFPNDGATGTGDYLRVDRVHNSNFNLGTNDFTMEFWFNSRNVGSTLFPFAFAAPTVSGSTDAGFYIRFNGGVVNAQCFEGNNTIGACSTGSVSMNTWYHVAYVRNGSTFTIYLDGTSAATASSAEAVNYDAGWNFNIGSAYTNVYHYNGVLSNLRIVNGKALYTSNFTVPTRQLEVTPETVLLCCHSSQDHTQEATGKTLTPIRTGNNSGPLLSTFTPDVGKDYARYGTVLEGNVEFPSLNYMTLPRGTTTEAFVNFGGASAANARGVFSGGVSEPSPTRHDEIDYITIATTGNATDFGNLTAASQFPAALASNIRGVIAGAYVHPALVNKIDYVTIQTTGNAADFGDLTGARNQPGACSNSTRGLIAGGNPETDTTDYIQIQSTGNALDFGNLTNTIQNPGGCADLTRAVFGGGEDSPTTTNVIQYFTIPTQSNATDFGDLSQTRRLLASGSSPTLGFWFGGADNSSTYYDRIDYVTIQTLGNAADFGNLSAARAEVGAVTSTLRACVGGGYVGPSTPQTNIVEYITMATAGDMTDFGDLTVARRQVSGCSNGHGGLG